MPIKSGLITQSFMLDFKSEESEELVDAVLAQIDFKIIQLVESINLAEFSSVRKIEWQSTRSIFLDSSSNFGRCENCNCWVSDKKQHDYISQLSIGTIYEGKLLCDLCLPENHELAF